eukprot:SAG11_NODE_807_length_7088_cov_6.548862_2_plen_68_part_00
MRCNGVRRGARGDTQRALAGVRVLKPFLEALESAWVVVDPGAEDNRRIAPLPTAAGSRNATRKVTAA